MLQVEWQESMSIGVDEIDAQHKQLLALVNETAETAQRPVGNDKKGETLRRLCDYVVLHFASEEALMDPEAYGHYDQHIQEHIDCSMRALDFMADYSAGKDVSLEEFLEFAAAWVQHHIRETDKTLGVFLAQRRA